MTGQATRTGSLDSPMIAHISNGEPAWLGELRRDWWRRVEEQPWPLSAEEEWRRTSLDDLPRDGELLIDPPKADYQIDPALAGRGVVFTDLAPQGRRR